MDAVEAIRRLNQRELDQGITGDASWHYQYRHSAYIFIGNLDHSLSEDDIITIFSQFGEVVDLNLAKDKLTKKSKGFAFLAYEDQRSTILAVDNMNGFQLFGRTIRVDHAGSYRKPKKKENANDAERYDSDDDYEERRKRIWDYAAYGYHDSLKHGSSGSLPSSSSVASSGINIATYGIGSSSSLPSSTQTKLSTNELMEHDLDDAVVVFEDGPVVTSSEDETKGQQNNVNEHDRRPTSRSLSSQRSRSRSRDGHRKTTKLDKKDKKEKRDKKDKKDKYRDSDENVGKKSSRYPTSSSSESGTQLVDQFKNEYGVLSKLLPNSADPRTQSILEKVMKRRQERAERDRMEALVAKGLDPNKLGVTNKKNDEDSFKWRKGGGTESGRDRGRTGMRDDDDSDNKSRGGKDVERVSSRDRHNRRSRDRSRSRGRSDTRGRRQSRSRSRSRSRDRVREGKSRRKEYRSASRSRSRSKGRSRSRSRDRDRYAYRGRDRDRDRDSGRGGREHDRDRERDRSRERYRDRERDEERGRG